MRAFLCVVLRYVCLYVSVCAVALRMKSFSDIDADVERLHACVLSFVIVVATRCFVHVGACVYCCIRMHTHEGTHKRKQPYTRTHTRAHAHTESVQERSSLTSTPSPYTSGGQLRDPNTRRHGPNVRCRPRTEHRYRCGVRGSCASRQAQA